jgi:hypothetical protein
MAGEEKALGFELIGNRYYIGDEVRHCVGAEGYRFAAQIVAALIGHDHAKPGLSERSDLLVPRIPKLREAMQQDQQRTTPRTGSDSVNTHFGGVKQQMLKLYAAMHAAMIAAQVWN